MTAVAQPEVSRLGAAYERVYGMLAGTRPGLLPWHFQWLATCDIRRDMAEVLPSCRGELLDIGCGAKPYRALAKNVDRYIGMDIEAGPDVDLVLVPGQPIPLPDASVDAILCTQVLEHVADFGQVWSEIHRVLRPGGRLIATVPFTYNEHGSPHDYRRFSVHGIRRVATDEYDVLDVRRQGGVGSTVVMLCLNWWDFTLGLTRPTRILKGLLLPLWLPLCLVANLAGWCLDRLDRTGMFYHNVMLVAIRR
jgi:SAM-dependent methyltransferase